MDRTADAPPDDPDADPTSANDFAAHLRAWVPADNVRADPRRDAVYLYAPAGGVGIPADVYHGWPWVLTESIGIETLRPSHRLYYPDAHHVLCFRLADDA
jgi:hypothetical protein